MGRAQNTHKAISTDGFAVVLGQRRGSDGSDELDSGHPSGSAQEKLRALCAQVSAGELQPALRVLVENRGYDPQPPLVCELRRAVGAQLLSPKLLERELTHAGELGLALPGAAPDGLPTAIAEEIAEQARQRLDRFLRRGDWQADDAGAIRDRTYDSVYEALYGTLARACALGGEETVKGALGDAYERARKLSGHAHLAGLLSEAEWRSALQRGLRDAWKGPMWTRPELSRALYGTAVAAAARQPEAVGRRERALTRARELGLPISEAARAENLGDRKRNDFQELPDFKWVRAYSRTKLGVHASDMVEIAAADGPNHSQYCDPGVINIVVEGADRSLERRRGEFALDESPVAIAEKLMAALGGEDVAFAGDALDSILEEHRRLPGSMTLSRRRLGGYRMAVVYQRGESVPTVNTTATARLSEDQLRRLAGWAAEWAQRS